MLLSCSVTKSCPALCDPMDCGTPGFPILHYLLEFTQTHVRWIGDATQPSLPLLPASPSALNLSQHQSLFLWVSSSHQMAKVWELQLQHQSFQWVPRVDFLQDWLVWSPCCPRDFSRVFSSTTIWTHQFSGVQPSLSSNPHIRTCYIYFPINNASINLFLMWDLIFSFIEWTIASIIPTHFNGRIQMHLLTNNWKPIPLW